MRVFISHAHTDRSSVQKRLVDPLRAQDIDVWYAPENLEPGTDWEDAIRAGLESSDWFLVVLTPEAVASRWVRAEVQWAMDERPGRLIPILLTDCPWQDTHLLIRQLQYLDFREPALEEIRRLLAFWDLDSDAAKEAVPSATGPIDATAPSVDETFVNAIGIKMLPIPAGQFLMGSPPAELRRASEEYLHEVVITRSFWISAHPVTQAEYESLVNERPSAFSIGGRESAKVEGLDTAHFPVEGVSWDDAAEFCARLSASPQELARGIEYRLPTEAEWEYTCRAGSSSPFSFGPGLAGEHANCDGREPYGIPTRGTFVGRPTQVGPYAPNGFGIFDMHGNVWEWCQDWYSVNAYSRSQKRNPRGPSGGTCRVVRGGAWSVPARLCRSACREWYSPSRRLSSLGFRIAASPRR